MTSRSEPEYIVVDDHVGPSGVSEEERKAMAEWMLMVRERLQWGRIVELPR